MAFDLSSITRGKRLRAPKIVVYGPPKIGKSTFAASAPSAVGILTEEGLDNIDVAAFPVAKTYEDVLAAIGTLANDPHEFNSVFVDSLDWLEPLILGKICRENGVDNIEKIAGALDVPVHALLMPLCGTSAPPAARSRQRRISHTPHQP